MRILTRKKQNAILERISECNVIALTHIGLAGDGAFDRISDNLNEISRLVGGSVGNEKFLNDMWKYCEKDK